MTNAANIALGHLAVQGVHITAVVGEIVLSVGAMLLLIGGSRLGRRSRALPAAGALVVIVAAGASLLIWSTRTFAAFDSAVAQDGFSLSLKMVLLFGAAMSVLVGHSYIDQENAPAPEFFGLLLFATAGMMLMVSATDLILIFVALETFSLALYVLTGFRRTRADSQEGALKYFLTGSFSSAFFLYGTALIYGATSSTRLALIQQHMSRVGTAHQGLASAGLALIIIGLAFKIAAVPFHMWTPDAYQGAPAPVTGFMAAGSKVAGFAVLLRILVVFFPAMAVDWRPVVVSLSVISMVVGSIIAVAQSNVKRMLAYSAIAHSGFLLIGIASGNDRGISGSVFYLGAYTFTVIASFAIIYAVGRPGEPHTSLEDYKGLWYRRPFLAVMFAVCLVSLAGVPPTIGFWAKFEVFSAGVSANLVPLVVVAVLSSAVAAFFYLRVIVLMFLEEPKGWTVGSIEPSTAPGIGLAVMVAASAILVFGVVPGPILTLLNSSTMLGH
ncbi:MAG: NADH-quinone oxidoreductase subunit N [Actinomycetota bacterium]|nr:NADH-quinone oxidoreductase subunit N [Actinomycetota bacterium]